MDGRIQPDATGQLWVDCSASRRQQTANSATLVVYIPCWGLPQLNLLFLNEYNHFRMWKNTRFSVLMQTETRGIQRKFCAQPSRRPADRTQSTFRSSESLMHRWYFRRHVRQTLRDGGENRSPEAANLRGLCISVRNSTPLDHPIAFGLTRYLHSF